MHGYPTYAWHSPLLILFCLSMQPNPDSCTAAGDCSGNANSCVASLCCTAPGSVSTTADYCCPGSTYNQGKCCFLAGTSSSSAAACCSQTVVDGICAVSGGPVSERGGGWVLLGVGGYVHTDWVVDDCGDDGGFVYGFWLPHAHTPSSCASPSARARSSGGIRTTKPSAVKMQQVKIPRPWMGP